MNPIDRLNDLLDTLPRTRFFALGREVPAFRSCGIAGFHLAAVVVVSTGLARGRSLAVLAALCAICGVSFFAYALLRRRITGREQLVLLEHVWFALAFAALFLLATGEPPLGYLDAVACGLAFFLAGGRIGCFLVGCCHGFPSTLGVRYGERHVRDGFPAGWVGVRLFPLQLVEWAALVLIGAGSVLFAILAADGAALAFFLVAYAVVRFGIEGLRGDERPHLLGVSQSRWMAVAEVGVAVALDERARAHPWAIAVLALVGAAALLHAATSTRVRATRAAHLAELRAAAASTSGGPLTAMRTSLRFAVAFSPADRGRVISLSRPGRALDLPLLCAVAGGAFPGLDAATAVLSPSGVLLFEVPTGTAPASPGPGARLHAQLARERQRAAEVANVGPDVGPDVEPNVEPSVEPAPAPAAPGRPPVTSIDSWAARGDGTRATYFAGGRSASKSDSSPTELP